MVQCAQGRLDGLARSLPLCHLRDDRIRHCFNIDQQAAVNYDFLHIPARTCVHTLQTLAAIGSFLWQATIHQYS